VLTAETLRAEGARYAAQVVCIPGLWMGPSVWRAFASYLGHRGWECHLLELRGVRGGVAARATAVAEYVAALPSPAILLGHDAGAVVALAAAARGAALALVLLAPLSPGSRATRRLTLAPRNLLPLVLGGRVPPPGAGAGWLDLPEPGRSRLAADLAPDDAAMVRELAWGRLALPRAAGIPALVIAGDHDALVPPDAAAGFARATGAELQLLAGAGHWPLAGPSWQAAVALVHRWLVQRLGAPLLELYAEAMAERDADDEGGE
jgi:pimeloyl-ACP methyl ester carboxylesterase